MYLKNIKYSIDVSLWMEIHNSDKMNWPRKNAHYEFNPTRII